MPDNHDLLRAPFPWYGGKTRAAHLIWERLGDVPNYVEPFAGSLAVLLGRPHVPKIETVNDLDAYLANVWRALQHDPAGTADWADQPVNEADLHARHLWLREHREALTARLMGDPDYYDSKIAGWWLWGIACWIGGGWCGPGGAGPWGIAIDADGNRQRVHLGNAGQGVYRQRVHLGNAGQGVTASGASLTSWFAAIQERLRRVRVCCGDWQRVMGDSVTHKHGLTGILLDPPYSTEENRDMNIYAEDSGTVAHAVRAWCLANGHHPLLRIVLCGYAPIHDALLAHGWTAVPWKTNGGYGNQGAPSQATLNATRETLYCSPHCLQPSQLSLWKEP